MPRVEGGRCLLGRRELAPGGISRIVPEAPWPRWILSQLLKVERSVQTILMVWASSLVLSKQSNSSQWDPSRLSSVTCTSSGEARTKKPKDASYISTFFVSSPRYHRGKIESTAKTRRERKTEKPPHIRFITSFISPRTPSGINLERDLNICSVFRWWVLEEIL